MGWPIEALIAGGRVRPPSPALPGQTRWSKALVRHGADPRVALAGVLGVSAENVPRRLRSSGGFPPRGVLNLRHKQPERAKSTQENGRIIMPLFLTQGRFTREYIKGGLAKPEDRHAATSRLCEQVGGKLVSLYFTLGQYDFIVISDMPDAKAVSMLAFVATGGGGIEGSVTTQAFTTAEARDMLTAAGKIAGSYKPMGAS